MNNETYSKELSLLESSQTSAISLVEASVGLPVIATNAPPMFVTQGGIAIGAIWAVSLLLREFRLLVEALDKDDDR